MIPLSPLMRGIIPPPPRFAACLLAAAFSSASAVAGGLDAPQPVAPYFNGVFPEAAPGGGAGWSTENAFPNLTFTDPLWLTEVPGSGELLVTGKNGRIWRFENDPAATQAVEVLDWSAMTETSGDQGFYSLVFHPQFGQPGQPGEHQVFACYSRRAVEGIDDDDRTYWRVSRFTWNAASGTIDPASEFVLVNQYDPHGWHNGGAMFFDDVHGYLHVVCGDGGDSHDNFHNTQRIDKGFFSGLFRLDVDYQPGSLRSHGIRRQPQEDPAWNKPAEWPASATQGYGIPNDNPWLDESGAVLEEFYAIGFRSPHTMHYDPPTGDIYLGDVGQNTREELTRIVAPGSNAQWAYQEGTVAGARPKPAVPLGIEQVPLLDYGRTTGGCIIGGMRYRGAKWSEQLGGKVIFGDFNFGKVWTATPDAGGGAPVVEEIVGGLPVGGRTGLGNFFTDSDGEIYLMILNGTDQPGGTIRKLAVAPPSVEPPALLSQTGVFTDLATLAPAPGVLPYDVANPLWSDGASKRRWIILSNDGSHDSHHEDIVFSESDNWLFPAGTVFVKHFEVATDPGDPSSVKRLETRFLICTGDGGKYGVTYKWNAAGTDAALLAGGLEESYGVVLPGGGTGTRTWSYPSRSDCLLCHNEAAGQALGFRTHQLNRDFHYGTTGRTANQLATFNELGMFDVTLTVEQLAGFLAARALDDATAPLEHRVRSYLDSNCSHCHRPGGPVDHFDARLTTPLTEQGLINGLVQGHFSLGPDGRYLKPGDPDLSAVHVRLAAAGTGAAMPPIAKNVVDQQAVDLMQQYLESLSPAEFEVAPSPLARYVMLTAYSEVNGNPWTSVGEFTVLDGNGSPIPVSELSLAFVSSEELTDLFSPAVRAIDGNPDSFWHTEWGGPDPAHPHYLGIDLGSEREVGGFIYTPRQEHQNGRIAGYDVHYGPDQVTWTQIKSGTWGNDAVPKRYAGLANLRKARCHLTGPAAVTVNGPFDVTIAFDAAVEDFHADDLLVTGGSVASLRGGGHYYVARISPAAASVAAEVPEDRANQGPGLLGSRASQVLTYGYDDVSPPVPAFYDMPVPVAGSFRLWLIFDEAVTGLEAGDFTLTNLSLDQIEQDGLAFGLHFTPLAPGPVVVSLNDGAVADLQGNAMGSGISATGTYLDQILGRNAGEFSYLGGGMVLPADAASPGGDYVALPNGAYAGNEALPVKTMHRAEYGFVVPHAGQWLLRGLVRPPNSSSDSFWVEIDGNQALGTVYRWDIGPIGTPYVWDLLSDFGGPDPVVLDLNAGTRTVTLYGREDGARLARLELESVRPLARLLGPVEEVGGSFEASLEFSRPVTGLDAGDFSIAGGTIQSVSGSGALYTVTIAPEGALVVVSLDENSATDGTGNGNFASNAIHAVHRPQDAYLAWAALHGVDGSPASLLADEDGDGVAKLLEFAFNLDPSAADRATYDPVSVSGSGLPRLAVSPGPLLSIQYLRRKGVAGLAYTAQFGPSPGEFAAAAGVPLVESLGPAWERVTVSDGAGGGQPRRFARVMVTMDPP